MSIIDDKHVALGGAGGFLGQPVTPEFPTPNGLGSFRHYQGGSIYWKHTIPLAFEVHGLIREKWKELGWENSFMGFPVSDELTPLPGGAGRTSNFEGGAIGWTPTTGAHEIHGAIFRRWVGLGRENRLGFPLTDETTTPDQRGRFNHFQNGSVYWTPTTGAHEVTDNIKDAWAGLGWEKSPLGYPVNGPERMLPTLSPTDFQDFEHGSLYNWLGNNRVVMRNPAVVAISGQFIQWPELSAASTLSDRDRIAVQFSGHPPNGAIQITLNAAPGVSSWKAISVWSPSQGDIAEISTEGRRTSATLSIQPGMVEPGNVFLVFKKAKFLGIHTGMYWLNRPDRLIGNNVTFSWLRD